MISSTNVQQKMLIVNKKFSLTISLKDTDGAEPEVLSLSANRAAIPPGMRASEWDIPAKTGPSLFR